MKLSHLTIGVLILSASILKAQDKNHVAVLKQDTTKSIKKTSTHNKIKIVKKDSIKQSKVKNHISADYCPPCGMG